MYPADGNAGAVVLTNSRVGCLELGEQRADCLNRRGKFQKRLIERDRVRTSNTQSADPARAGMECRGGTDAPRKPLKAAARRAQQKAARRDQAGERRGRREDPFDETFWRRAQARLARLRAVFFAHEIGRLFDKASLRSPPATKQKNIGTARRLQREAKPVPLVFGLDQGAARVIGDNAKALPRRSRNSDVAEKAFDLGRHKGSQRPRQNLGQIAARPSGRPILAKNYGGQHPGVS